jgi:hypothetical protein
MKFALSLIALAVSTQSFADLKTLHTCKNTSVNDFAGHFEEGLGQYGDQEADEDSWTSGVSRDNGKLRVSVGQMSYDESKYKITAREREIGGLEYIVELEEGRLIVLIVEDDGIGRVLYRPKAGARVGVLAEIDCNL